MFSAHTLRMNRIPVPARCFLLYEPLLRAGVRIYEYEPATLHAKTVVVDDAWSIVGSMNFDNRSLALNSETAAVVQDSSFAARMTSMFNDDLARSGEILLEAYKKRGVLQRALERVAHLLSRVL